MALDTLAHTVSFYDRGAQPPGEPQFRYTEPEEGVLRLEGTFEEKPTTVVMRRTEQGRGCTRVPLDQRVPVQPLGKLCSRASLESCAADPPRPQDFEVQVSV